MNKIRFLLINPASATWRASKKGKPPSRKVFRFSMLSSLQVAVSMPPNVETQILDEDVEPVDFDTDADLIGISLMTYNAPRVQLGSRQRPRQLVRREESVTNP